MQTLTPKQFFAIAGVKAGTFKAATSRDEVALAFGTKQALAGGKFLDLDAVAWMLVDELTPAFGRKHASVLIRAFSDEWMKGLGKAEAQREPAFLIVIEIGARIPGWQAIREKVNVTHGTLAELSEIELVGKKTIPDRITLVNISSIVARIRANALQIGIELLRPLCPPLDDPDFIAACEETKRSREKLLLAKEARS